MVSLDAVAETDLAVAALSGGRIEENPTHLVIRTPANPTYHWGNFLQVTDETLAADPAACVELFRQEFPQAPWIAIGLPAMPQDPNSWAQLGIGIQTTEALLLAGRPRVADLPPGYSARQLMAFDWEASAELAIRENDHTGEFDAAEFEEFARKQALVMVELTDTGKGAWFGAFADGVLVSDLGIVVCGRRARYRSVGTDVAHRGRGLASHLLGLAADWALARGCSELVIVTETINPAGRLYRRAGFEPICGSVAAYRH